MRNPAARKRRCRHRKPTAIPEAKVRFVPLPREVISWKVWESHLGPRGIARLSRCRNIRRIASSNSLVFSPLTFAARRTNIQPQQATIHRSRNVAVSGINRKPGGFVCTRLSFIYRLGWKRSIRFASELRSGLKPEAQKLIRSVRPRYIVRLWANFLPNCRNTCTGSFVPFTTISDWPTNMIVGLRSVRHR
jgi:hypothetical protein